MVKISQYPGGFRNGVTIRNLPVNIDQANNVFYVSSVFGSDNLGNKGTFISPFASVANALKSCAASKGDIIICLPNHVETVTAAYNINVQGVKVVGLSVGDGDIPTFKLATNDSATINLNAADVQLAGFKVIANVAATVCVTMASTGCVVNNCQILDGSSSFVTGISIVNGNANGADRCSISNCLVQSAGATQGILLGEVDDKVIISECDLIGTFSTAIIQNPTGHILTNLIIQHVNAVSTTSSGATVNLVSACTGMIANTHLNTAGTATKATGSLISTGNNSLATTAF